MKLSVIWIFEGGDKKHAKTLASLESLFSFGTSSAQILLYGAGEKWISRVKETFAAKNVSVYVSDYKPRQDYSHLVYLDALKHISEEWVTMVYSGDTYDAKSLMVIDAQQKSHPDLTIFMACKDLEYERDNDERENFQGLPSERWLKKQKSGVVDLSEEVECFPFFLGGTFIKREYFTEDAISGEEDKEGEKRFLLDLSNRFGKVFYVSKAVYHSSYPYEGDRVYNRRLYDTAFYFDTISRFWIPYLDSLKEKEGSIPEFIQYHAFASVRNLFLANMNNKNKHLVEGREEEFKELVHDFLQRIDDKVLFNEKDTRDCKLGGNTAWIMGILKHGEDFHFSLMKKKGQWAYGYEGYVVATLEEAPCRIAMMEDRGDHLEIDGSVDAVLYDLADEIYFMYGDEKFPVIFNGRYMYRKYFGIPAYKHQTFNILIGPLKDEKSFIGCFARFGEVTVPLALDFESSHFSRIGPLFRMNYWSFGNKKRYLLTKKGKGLLLRKTNRGRVCLQETLLLFNMLFSLDLRAKLFIGIRLAFFITRPFIKRRPIWMYLDKIYKAGDSSEYLFRYAMAQNDDISHYYLIDKDTPDYERLVKDGYKPLVRRSIMHRLVFLMADMMVISNSTVFSFNDFGKINSSYVRDLHHFHVCCVQHGMSVQKIAIAQNRLKDNTELYFCASKYEIENLSKPVYDYEGYDALKLTGVPRYDGLKNRDKKQILISPTWRMQAAIPIKGSEGHQRGYNVMFKKTPYYQVYNSLINDKRLIEAAKEYGYRIMYVLHPIVSIQEKDFEKNEYVDIVPAVGDMSYEKVFCESSLMVTDFSGVQFDFAYMRKPVVYLHHDSIPKHYEEGSFFYDTMAFGEICNDNDSLVDVLIDYMKNGCKMKEEYRKRADDFFYYSDDHNCERIYKVCREYLDEKVLPGAVWEKRWRKTHG
ncbi:MAG: CDP-glycerol glycerophosphotransferase family protein [Lachnospiraceae bacterium]|nr:CDP-glycerol glycerophosphotransferase family protein [Lachnospiraceae bacterium]